MKYFQIKNEPNNLLKKFKEQLTDDPDSGLINCSHRSNQKHHNYHSNI